MQETNFFGQTKVSENSCRSCAATRKDLEQLCLVFLKALRL